MKLRRLKVAATASGLAACLSGCQQGSPALEYLSLSPGENRVARITVEPNVFFAGTISLVIEPPAWKRGDPWGQIFELYHAKLGWVDNNTFVIVGDAVQYDTIAGGEYADPLPLGPVKVLTCVRRREDCTSLEARLKPHTKYIRNFQSALAKEEDWKSTDPIVQDLPPTPPSSR